MKYIIQDPAQLGRIVRETRKALGLNQPDLALTAGVGVRLLVEIEKGKPTAQIGKVMQVLAALGIEIGLSLPSGIEVKSGGSNS
ncbi:helix-turn-helix transcriptional regulator [Microvirga sp. ACRRW]|uniref:helix-turn-helix transcriptional regulator n=1 Tax=Microvirga sp. ACRRW TaxID=2918205 RepID=UPI001EF485C4|nr:helix-turn-helix transcriptional regulator [Microvirga sp. ACRRW]MCG7392645.1 helix-turn-helix transcriptional regulator [Microvirga sp. ACRRW]